MATPKNTRARIIAIQSGGAVHVYSNENGTYLQIRRSTPTEEDILQPSFKVAVCMTKEEIMALANELLIVASRQIQQALEQQTT